MADVSDAWKRIEGWLGTFVPDALAWLASPATPAALDSLEALVGAALPADFHASALIHDGQRRGGGLYDGAWSLMPVAKIERKHRMLEALRADGGARARCPDRRPLVPRSRSPARLHSRPARVVRARARIVT